MKTPMRHRAWGSAAAVAMAGSLLVACTDANSDPVPSADGQPTATASPSPTTTTTPSASPSADPTPTSTSEPAEKVPEGFRDGIEVVKEAYGEEWAERLVSDGDYLISLLYGGGLTGLVGARDGDQEFHWRVLEDKLTASAMESLVTAVNDDENIAEFFLAMVTDDKGTFGELDGKVLRLDANRGDRPNILMDFASEAAVGLKGEEQAYYVRDVDVTAFVEGGRFIASYRVMYLLLPGPDGQWIIDGWQRKVLGTPTFQEN